MTCVTFELTITWGGRTLTKNLFNSFTISGNFTVFVPKNLPLLVEGNATVPDRWIEATIGYLSQTNQSYKVKIVVLNDSEVTFEDYEEQQ